MQPVVVILPLPLTEGTEESERLFNALPKERQEKILRAPDGKKQQSLAAYLCLTEACHRKTGRLFLPEYEAGSHTRLTCGLYANISHTENAVMAAVSDTPVGVDIQAVRPVPDALVLRVLGREAGQSVLAQADKDRAFALAWARKEALYKALGTGLNGKPQSEEGWIFETGILENGAAFAVCYTE